MSQHQTRAILFVCVTNLSAVSERVEWLRRCGCRLHRTDIPGNMEVEEKTYGFGGPVPLIAILMGWDARTGPAATGRDCGSPACTLPDALGTAFAVGVCRSLGCHK